ncbi:MAG: hypothetical protein AABY64_04755 [Bdellovibrionota bacterium]
MKFVFIASLPLFFLFSLISYAEEKPTTTVPAPAPEEKSITDYFLLCKNLKIVRTLRVESTPQKCTTIYTKLGQDRSIGSSQRPALCRDFAHQVRDTLVNAGWKCKEVKSGVSHHNE